MNASKAARLLGRLGAAKGGKARAARLTPDERSEAARVAVRARWARVKSRRRAAACTTPA